MPPQIIAEVGNPAVLEVRCVILVPLHESLLDALL